MTAATLESLLAATIRRRLTRTVVIKDSKAFDRLYGELQAALTRAWDDEMRKAIIAALDRLRDLGGGAFTAGDAASIMRVLEERVGAEAIRAAMREPVVNLTDALFRTGAAEIGRAASVDIAFMRPDLDALDALKDNNLFWVGEHWDRHTKEKLDTILTEYFTDGMTRDDLTRRMADDFRTLTSRSHIYWEAVADHMATKGREIGRVTGYERAGIQKVQIRAHLDERTTPCCRRLHGRVIEVQTLVDQRDAYFEASARGDKLLMADIWVMHGKGADLSGTRTRDLKGVGSPPYHYRCRTITVAYWETPAEISGPGAEPDPAQSFSHWKRAAYNRDPLPRKEVGAIIDRARTANWAGGKAGDVARAHFEKHATVLGVSDQAAFNQGAVDNIRRAGRDVYTSIRDGVLRGSFVRPHTRIRSNGRELPGYIVTVVDLEKNRLITHHFRTALPVASDEVPPMKQGGWGIAKWLFG